MRRRTRVRQGLGFRQRLIAVVLQLATNLQLDRVLLNLDAADVTFVSVVQVNQWVEFPVNICLLLPRYPTLQIIVIIKSLLFFCGS